ncbi:MAG: hypothetical protein LBH58_07745 [Tannerellaceae bacterium]|jgi:hypothetical protein|nr:hypothetical protein [Tannerellaceae bacterium]
MKLSTEPTKHILIRACSQSEWDSCDFALITCEDHWKEGIKEKLETIKTFKAPDSFISFKFYDNSVEFYQSEDDEAEILSGEKEWDFVTLKEGEKESFKSPESRLETGLLILYKDGTGFYKTYGKYTNEEFYTTILPLKTILESM